MSIAQTSCKLQVVTSQTFTLNRNSKTMKFLVKSLSLGCLNADFKQTCPNFDVASNGPIPD